MTVTRRFITATIAGVATVIALSIQAPTARAETPPNLQISFTKWITTFPAMEGVVGGDVVGDFAGTVLNIESLAGGKIYHLEALYQIVAGNHSFVAHIQGTQTGQTQHAVLNGEVVDGWLAGAQVHVEYDVVDCHEHGVCFQGAIRIMASSAK